MQIISNYKKNIVNKNCCLREALEIMDAVDIKILFIEESNKLLASLTDGDIRRAILRGASLDIHILKFANKSPIFIYEDDEVDADKLLQEKNINAIPVINRLGDILRIYATGNPKSKKSIIQKKDIPIIIMAGGRGTRLYPYTRVLPKPLIPIDDIPIVERIMCSFQAIGCRIFHMIVNYKKEMIKSYFAESERQFNITFWDENEPLGTGGGLSLVRAEMQKTFILTNCDILINDDVNKIIEHHRKEKNVATLVCSLKNFQIPYGIVRFGEGGEILSFEEKPTLSFFTNTGYYILEPAVFNYIKENEQIGMPEIIERMKKSGEKVGIYPISENAWLDMGQIDSMEVMERKFRELRGTETI